MTFGPSYWASAVAILREIHESALSAARKYSWGGRRQSAKQLLNLQAVLEALTSDRTGTETNRAHLQISKAVDGTEDLNAARSTSTL